jgi:hypothetical protein
MAVIVLDHTFLGNPNLEELSLWVIPITLRYGDKQRTIQTLLDTGAQRTIISYDVQGWMDLPTQEESITGIGVTGRSRYIINQLDRLEIGSIMFTDIEILVGKLPKGFDKYLIDGILGGDILKMIKLTLDYPEKLLKIEKKIVS